MCQGGRRWLVHAGPLHLGFPGGKRVKSENELTSEYNGLRREPWICSERPGFRPKAISVEERLRLNRGMGAQKVLGSVILGFGPSGAFRYHR